MTAEERAITQFKNTFCPTCEDKDICDVSILNCTFYDSIYKQAYLAGLEAGKPKWHDLREDPNDVPKDKSNVLMFCGYYTFGFYDVEEKVWLEFEYANVYKDAENVIAWVDIPKFEGLSK